MAYATPASFVAGAPLTAVQLNLLRSDFEEVAKQPMGYVYSTANQTLGNSATVGLTFAANYALHNMTFASSALTIVESGLYLGILSVTWGSSTAGVRAITLNMNGTPQAANHQTPGAPANWAKQQLSTPMILAAGQVVTATAFQDSGGNLIIGAGAQMFIGMISRF